MKCDVFRGIGGTAHKYYVLFQHHLPPPSSTYTTGKDAVLMRAVQCRLFEHSLVADLTKKKHR